jgi:uncharacterized protein YceK
MKKLLFVLVIIIFIGCNSIYEKHDLLSIKTDDRYSGSFILVSFESEWAINHADADDEANIMHDRVVDEISEQLKGGNQYCA